MMTGNICVAQLGVMLAGSSTSVLDLTLPIVIGTQPLKQTLVPGLESECTIRQTHS